MIFSSPTFLFIFLPLVFLLNLAIKRVQVKNIVLIVFSLLFYAWGEPIYVLLMVASSFANYLLALLMDRSETKKQKKLYVIVTVVLNIGVLVFFKYSNLFIDTINSIAHINIPGIAAAMPVGISFFTFQAMSYVLDVYFGKINVQRNFFNILLYISLFPQMIAGPIVKYREIEEQIYSREISLEKIAAGIRRFCVGLGKKVLVANICAKVVDTVYAIEAGSINFSLAWIGALFYAVQIYFDFSGYSDMAIGLGKMFGFEFTENFNYPYISKSVSEFWRRWHISLSTWFREYVYIPLGGNRKGRARTILNKFIVFFLTGFWHGANWTFVGWGLYNGAFLMLEELTELKKRRIPKLLLHIYTVLVYVIGFVIFRADNFAQAWLMIRNMFTGFSFNAETASLVSQVLSPIAVFVFTAALVAATPICGFIREKCRASWLEPLSYCLAFVLFVLSVFALSTSMYNPFIYFRF